MKRLELIDLLLLTASFHYLFYQHAPGINAVIWATISIGWMAIRHSSWLRSPFALASAAAVLVASSMVVINHSIVSVMAALLSYITWLGFAHQATHKSVWFAGLSGILGWFTVFGAAGNYIGEHQGTKTNWGKTWYYLRVAGLPILAVAIFYGFYVQANPAFSDLNNLVFADLGNWLSTLLDGLSLPAVFFFMFSATVAAVLFFKSTGTYFARIEARLPTVLQRKKRNVVQPPLPYQVAPTPRSLVALKSEYRSALFLLVAMNVLLVIVNFTDLFWLWIDFSPAADFNLSQFVHEGTWLLVATILMAMALLIWIFRGNINFLRHNKNLRLLAYGWIAQNAFLVFSVALRNFHYFDQYGLSYKRIGVWGFLLLTLFGLATMWLKIRDKRTFYYLFRANTWAAFSLLILLSVMNWDTAIANYNLRTVPQQNLDIGYLLTLSDKVLPILQSHSEQLDRPVSPMYSASHRHSTYRDWYYERVGAFDASTGNQSWQSWNWADSDIKAHLRMPVPNNAL